MPFTSAQFWDDLKLIVTATDAGIVNFYLDWVSIWSVDQNWWTPPSKTEQVLVGNATTNNRHGDTIVDLIEIYDYARTAEQVENDYNWSTFKDISLNNLLLNIDSRMWSIYDKQGNEITNTAVETVTDGTIYAQEYDGSTSLLNIDSTLPALANTTTGTWICWVKGTGVSWNILAFGDANVNEVISIEIRPNMDFRVLCTKASVNQWLIDSTDPIFTDNSRKLVAVTQDGISPTIYINGKSVSQSFIISTDVTVWFNDLTWIDNWRVGCRNIDNLGDVHPDTFWWKRGLLSGWLFRPAPSVLKNTRTLNLRNGADNKGQIS